MSKAPPKQLTPPALRSRKGTEPITCLTSYTASMTTLVDPHVDLILVGDSLAMTIYGMTSTIGVTIEMMIAHGRAVAKTARHACVVVDLESIQSCGVHYATKVTSSSSFAGRKPGWR
jgi:3-methyl-2-oxobutanoate hydroxymethyltransferase